MTFTQQQKKTAYISLNPSVQYFITDPESREISEKISKQYSLDFDQTDNLDEEIDNTILGLQSFREMIINLRQKLGLSDDKIIELARDLKQQIFDKLDEIKKGEIQYQIPETFISTPTQLKAKINPPTTYNSQPTTYKEPNQTNTKQNALERMDGVFNKTAPAPGNLPSQPTTDNKQQTTNFQIPKTKVVEEYHQELKPPTTNNQQLTTNNRQPNQPIQKSPMERKLEQNPNVMKSSYGNKPDPYRESPQ